MGKIRRGDQLDIFPFGEFGDVGVEADSDGVSFEGDGAGGALLTE